MWKDMKDAPREGKHVILAVISECGCFIWAVQGAFMGGKWCNAANIPNEPLCWMPTVPIPNEFLPERFQ